MTPGAMTFRRLLSLTLLVAGVGLVFGGISHALGFTLPGMAASAIAIIALLYAGATWFGPAPLVPASPGAALVLVFDRDLAVVAGAAPGTPVGRAFPAALRPRIEAHCRAAIDGEATHFACEMDGQRLVIEAFPVAVAPGAVPYAVIIAGRGPALPRPVVVPAAVVP